MKALVIGLLVCIVLISPAVATSSWSTFTVEYFRTITNDPADTTWDVVHDATDGTGTGSTTIYPLIDSSATLNLWDRIQRGGLQFDTTSLNSSLYVTDAFIEFTTNAAGYDQMSCGSGGSYLDVVGFTPSGHNNMPVADFDGFDSYILGSIALSSVTHPGTYQIPLVNVVNWSDIDPDGHTYLGIMTSCDCADAEPGWIAGGNKYIGQDITGATIKLYVETSTEPPVPGADCVLNATPTSGEFPLDVTFTDESTGFNASSATYTIYYDDGYSDNGVYTSGVFASHIYNWAGTFNVTYTVMQDGYSFSDTATITVSDTSTNYEVSVSNSAGDPLSGVLVTIWYDGEEQDSDTTGAWGSVYFNVPDMRWVNGTAEKSGYQTASFSQYINTWDTWTTVTLWQDNETIPDDDWSQSTLIITFKDYETLDIINNVSLNIYSDISRETLYKSEYTTNGYITTNIINDTTYYFTAYAGGYWDEPFTFTADTTPENIIVYMTPKDYNAITPEIRCWVYSTSGQPIYNAYVSVSSSTDSGGGYTSLDGHYTYNNCTPIATGSRAYTIIASKGGYTSYTATVSISTESPTVTFYLTPTVNATATPTPTANYTPVVTPVWSGTNGTPGNLKELYLNYTMIQLGVGQAEAGILLGLIITVLCGTFIGGCLAGYGSGGGAGVGAIIGCSFGWVASGMLGLIPIWAIIVTIALVGMLFFIFRERDSG